MNTSNMLWQLRLVQNTDLIALSEMLDQITLEAIDPAEHQPDDQWLVAVPVMASESGDAMGCIRIRRNIGLAQPRYWYHVGSVVHAAPDLGLFHRQQTLLLGNDHTGCTELSDIATLDSQLDSDQKRLLTRLLVKAALLWVQQDTSRSLKALSLQPVSLADGATEKVIAELPGLSNSAGVAPFWQGLGQHFYAGDVHSARARFGELWLSHVAALLPRHPLVASLLNESAQAAIGVVHPDARMLQEALAEAGMRAGEHVNLYDAGPVFEGHITLLRGISGICQRNLKLSLEPQTTSWYLLLQQHALNGAQLCLLPGCLNPEGELLIHAADAERLALQSGAQVLAEEFKI